MLWIIAALTEAILQLVGDTFGLVSALFLEDIQLDIGAGIHGTPTSSPSVGTAIDTVLDISAIDKANLSAFDQVFGQVLVRYTGVITTVALAITTLIMIFKLVNMMVNPERSDKPFGLVGKFIATFILTLNAYNVFVLFEWGFNKAYLQFLDIAIGKETILGVTPDSKLGLGDFIIGNGTKLLSEVVPKGSVGASIVAGIVNIILIITILIGFLKLLLEAVQRYVLLGVMFYTAPLGFCTLLDSESKVFSNWVKMIASHFVCMMSSCFFLGTVCLAVRAYPLLDAVSGSYASYLLFMLMLVGWLAVGQRFDAYLKGLGLSTAQTGSGLGRAVLGTVIAARMLPAISKMGKGFSGGSELKGDASTVGGDSKFSMPDGPAMTNKMPEAGISPITTAKEAGAAMAGLGLAGSIAPAMGQAKGFENVASSVVTGPNGEKSMLMTDGGSSMAIIGPAAKSQAGYGLSPTGVPVAIIGNTNGQAARAANMMTQAPNHIREGSIAGKRGESVSALNTATGEKVDLDIGSAHSKVVSPDGDDVRVPTYAQATLTDKDGNVSSGYVFNGTTAGDGSIYDNGVDAYDSKALSEVADSAQEIQFGEGNEAMQGLFIPSSAFEGSDVTPGDIPNAEYAQAEKESLAMNYSDADGTSSGGYYAGSDIAGAEASLNDYVSGGSSMDQVFDQDTSGASYETGSGAEGASFESGGFESSGVGGSSEGEAVGSSFEGGSPSFEESSDAVGGSFEGGSPNFEGSSDAVGSSFEGGSSSFEGSSDAVRGSFEDVSSSSFNNVTGSSHDVFGGGYSQEDISGGISSSSVSSSSAEIGPQSSYEAMGGGQVEINDGQGFTVVRGDAPSVTAKDVFDSSPTYERDISSNKDSGVFDSEVNKEMQDAKKTRTGKKNKNVFDADNSVLDKPKK